MLSEREVKTDLGHSPGSLISFLRSLGPSQALQADFGLEPSGSFPRVTTAGCSQARPHLCRVLLLGNYHKSSFSPESLSVLPVVLWTKGVARG